MESHVNNILETTSRDKSVVACIRNVENFTDESRLLWEYIQCFRGPQSQDIETAVIVTVVNCIIFVTGVLGNVAVCVVIMKHKALSTPTDYYLLNLAIADLTLLIFGLPYDIMLYWYQYPWIFGQPVCQGRALISEMASYVSVLTVVTFSTERYVAICHPMYTLVMSSLRRSLRIILCIWVVSFICALPFAIYSGVDYIPHPNESQNIILESALCAMISQPENIPLTEISTTIFFLIPMTIIIYQYIKMGLVMIRNSNNNGQLGDSLSGCVHRKDRKYEMNNRNVVKMLSLVALGFFACWCPFHAQRLISVHLDEDYYSEEINYWMYVVTGILYYFSSTLNPILYNVTSLRMRNAFKEVMCGVKRTRRDKFMRTKCNGATGHRQCSNTSEVDDEKASLVRKKSIMSVIQKMSSATTIVDITEENNYQR
ncbi:unnamed protein product [Phaedon cochleariae]|uniref:G-protein coupled receptors family 1 profile domain-containing protein n=1 Tax=Phaedon cochleariae TaxID=80249 RepID=A0A9P0DU13_PHACE|nr:unnamed protein product [Phaedon cochleariae]